MPYNFEATFTQPILTKLDNGTIKGAKDWANTITKSYITTIKAGLPQGVPPTLPAPGLAVYPAPPPPYPIGTSPFTTADTRSRMMYNVIYAYYYAKEISLDKGAIEGLIADVKQLVIKIKVKTQEVKALIQTIKRVTEQLKQLPKIITEVIQGIKDEIKARIEDLKGLSLSLDEFKLQIGPSQFNSLFSQELALLDKIKKFNPLDITGLRELTLFVSQYGKRTNSILAATDNASLMKKYVLDKLFGVAKIFIELAKGVTDPTKILDFVSQLNRDTDRVKRLYERVKQCDVFIRFLQPRLRKLEKKKKDLISRIRNEFQKKLVELRKKLSEKIEEFTKKKQDGKANVFYKKATKIINDIKTKVQKQVVFYGKKIQLLQKALKSSISIVGKITSLLTALKLEFDAIKTNIAEERKQLAELLKGATEISLPGSVPTRPNFQINFNELSAAALKAELAKLSQYFAGLGLGEFANLGALVLTQTKCNLQTFKHFFEQKRLTISQYIAEMLTLREDIVELVGTLQELKTGTKKTPKSKKGSPKWISRIQSLSGLLHTLIVKIRPEVKKIQAWIRTKIVELRTYVKTQLTKFKEDLKVYAINLLPLKSDVQDAKDKKAEAEAKLKIIREKVAKVKSLILLGSFVAKMARGSIKLITNITKGNYKFSENQNSIDMILDGYFSYKSYNQSGPIVAGLLSEKQKVQTQFKSLLLIEALGYGLIETFKNIKETKFTEELNDIVQTQKANIPGAEVLKSFLDLVKNPPKTILEFKQAANIFTVGAINDANVATKIVDLERKHLAKSREVVATLCDIKSLEGTKFEKTLLKVKRTLDKNQSFILLAFHLLADEIKRLMLFINKKIQEFMVKVKKTLNQLKDKAMSDFKRQLKKEKDKKVNVDALAMSFAFGLAARLFWAGAQWTGPTGTNHISLTIGPFKPIKAKSTDGASKMIREIAKSFERQLQVMSGLAIPPPNTGIPPISFNGYK